MTAPTVLPGEDLEFPGWQLATLPGPSGMWSAWWASPDGRERWYIIAPSSVQLLERLRTITAETSG
jgi:hypothetical protein